MYSIAPMGSLVNAISETGPPPRTLDAALLPRLLPDVAIVFDARYARLVAVCVADWMRQEKLDARQAWLTLLCGDWCVYDTDDVDTRRPLPFVLLPEAALSMRWQGL